ncbi:4-hydroxybenzoate 3-monooxygenase [Pseudolabrys taiwanensis]|uniref:4-hydroxybenzoate 3-monooxygenase n=1 Tax=Pseudolabrys taiwanensis TaxID=331696 RepID=A0A345ZTY7_9HYPH|nr:4-hydroxybenzoate 3-monooxygenase [Pseudolabrys taiwanensis]AXK80384.1 4-hydroxybenzoate 3-monooxygenase [Pseudolabrys taiwanensis]
MRTQVGIVGAGPSGLMLSHLLSLAGIESIVIEDRSRSYCENRVRAGLMENWVAQMLIDTGVGERLKREAMVHDGIFLAFNNEAHKLDFTKLIDKHVYIYDQKEVVTDLIAHRLAHGGQILFEVQNVSVHDFAGASGKPTIRFTHQGKAETIECDFIAGCDGFHGICRPSLPEGSWTGYDRVYPFGWLGILSESPPPEKELIYAYHENGFALFSMRGPDLSRLYLQVKPDEDIEAWSEDRIWEELDTRLQGVRPLKRGKILQKGITPMRSYVAEPMQYGRMFLAGDAAHIVPPTGAKGMNLAMADVRVLARAFEAFFRKHETALLERYSTTVLKRVWKGQRFSWWMTQMLHRVHGGEYAAFDMKRQLAELDYVASSEAASTSLAENYAGLPID